MAELKELPMLIMPQVSLADEIDSALPLEHTTVNVQITGPVASVRVSQQFNNPLHQPAELDYLFPLPENAAITGFELLIGQRHIQGDLQEREAARAGYEEARGQGKRAGLLEQRRPNLFAVRLANVLPGEMIQATVHYQQRLKFEEPNYEFVFPMGLTPKYNSPQHPGEGDGVNPPVARVDEPIGPVEISLSVDAGLTVGEPVSPSHPLEIARLDERRFQIHLAGKQIPDHDFVLRYTAASSQPQAAAWVSGKPEQGFFLATFVPPCQDDEEADAVHPREFIFVLDRSGSMSGEPILQARNALRACLRALNPADTFRILLFDNEVEWFQPEPASVTQAQVELADAYLDQVRGRGGTEMVEALETALNAPVDSARIRYIVFLTDGAVSAESRLLEDLRGRLGTARLFTFGIGPSVNRALLNRMAELGRGRSSFLQLDEDIEGAIIRFQDSVSFPALTDLSLEWQSGKAWDIYPARLPDLYYGQPLEISGRVAYDGKSPLRLTLHGQRAGQPVTLSLTLPEPSAPDLTIERLWARARVENLLDQMDLEPQNADKLRADLLGLALQYNLVTAFTAFVAIDQDLAVKGGQPRILHVAQPLPRGLQPGGVIPGQMVQAAAFMPSPASFLGASGAQPPAPTGRSFFSKLRASAAKWTAPEESLSEGDQSGYIQPTMGRTVKETEPDITSTPLVDREGVLRWLARTQNVDGSWQGSVEWTSAALLAFIRAGHTTRSGSYRQALRRAARWLKENSGVGTDRYLRLKALDELAAATHEDQLVTVTQTARQELLKADNVLETAVLGQPVQTPTAVQSLDDLRLAAVLHVILHVPPDLLKGSQADLVRVWAAALSE